MSNAAGAVGLSIEEEAEYLAIANYLAALPTSSASSSVGAANNLSKTGGDLPGSSSGCATAAPLGSDDPPAHVLPLRKYLEATILPLLTRALESLALTKPNDPLEYLAAYLLSNNPVRQSPLPVPPCAALSGWLSAAAAQRAPAVAEDGSI